MSKKRAKTSRGKKAVKIVTDLLALIAFLCLLSALVSYLGDRANMKKALSFDPVEYTERIVPVKDDLGNWCFTTDRDLKVLQLTDVHIGGGWMSLKKDALAINAVAAMVTAEKPDLVIVTGDIAYPVPFQAGTFNNKSSAKIFASLMDQLGVYWTLCFGNHDTEAYSYYSREDMARLYEDDSYEYCLFRSGPEGVDGCGNQIISVIGSDGTVRHVMYLFDSHSYTDGDFLGVMWKYDNIHQNQIDWYSGNVTAYDELNAIAAGKAQDPPAGHVESTAWFHIPLTEFKDAWYEYANNGFNDTEDVRYCYGTAGEGKKIVYCGIGEDDLFETMQSLGSTKGVFCGHDHLNYFSLDYKGIRLTYGMSVDYLAYPGIYKLGSQRGCTVVTIHPDGSFDCTPESYYQDKYASVYQKENVTMQDITRAMPPEDEA